MKSIVVWDITQYSPVKVNRRFGNTSPASLGFKRKPSKKPVEAGTKLNFCYKLIHGALGINFTALY
jgi:hypothetical protein